VTTAGDPRPGPAHSKITRLPSATSVALPGRIRLHEAVRQVSGVVEVGDATPRRVDLALRGSHPSRTSRRELPDGSFPGRETPA
jgi:hypothetical protein